MGEVRRQRVSRTCTAWRPASRFPKNVAALSGCQLNELIADETGQHNVPANLATLDAAHVRFEEVIDNSTEDIEHARSGFPRQNELAIRKPQASRNRRKRGTHEQAHQPHSVHQAFVSRTRTPKANSVFGRGIADLCLGVREKGSLNAAAKSIGMAYSKAWRIIKETEAALEIQLLNRDGAHGSSLTDEGNKLLDSYLEIAKRVQEAAEKEFHRLVD